MCDFCMSVFKLLVNIGSFLLFWPWVVQIVVGKKEGGCWGWEGWKREKEKYMAGEKIISL